MNTPKTAMGELIEWMDKNYCTISTIKNKATELLGKEREQIIIAYDEGIESQQGIQTDDVKFGFKYYNQTFKNDKS